MSRIDPQRAGTFSPAFLQVRESVGDALHSAIHPNHPWSGCTNPDLVYVQMNRLADYLIDEPGAARAWIAFGDEYDRAPVDAEPSR